MIKYKKFNNLWFGLGMGILVPSLALFVYYFIRKADVPFWEFLSVYFQLGILTHIVSLSVLPNLLLFFGFLRINWIYSARGVLFATLLFAIFVAIIRFI